MNYDLASRAMVRMLSERVRLPYARENPHESTALPHLHYMLLMLQNNPVWSDGKKGRWLGWVQACTTFMGLTKLDELKGLNQACACEDEGCPHYNTLHIHP